MALHGWKSHQDGVRILFSERVVSGLRTLAIEGLAALPRRGVEVGGILFGRATRDEIQLEGFEEGPCEHRYGPSYALSETDRAKLSSLLRQRNGGMLPVVGFFRSFTSRGPAIEEVDHAFVREHFPHGNFVFLMLQPLSVEQCVASARFFRDGQLLPETEEPPFAFELGKMPTMEQAPERVPERGPRPLPQPVKQTNAEPAPELVPPLSEEPAQNVHFDVPHLVHQRASYQDVREELPGLRRSSEGARPQWWVAALICLLLVIGGALVYEMRTVASQPRWAELHLDVHSVNGRLDVTWDGNAARSLNATSGLLAVTDGNTHQDVALDPVQIRLGKYTLAPSHPDVGVRLILYAKGQGVAGDAVRVAAIPNLVVTPETPAPPAPSVAARTSVAEKAPVETLLRVSMPPTATHEVQPRIPAGIRSRINGQVVIPVEVEVSADGHVVHVRSAETGSDSVHLYLADQAKKAAWKWRFKPARTESGARVAANKTIQFVFTP